MPLEIHALAWDRYSKCGGVKPGNDNFISTEVSKYTCVYERSCMRS